MTHREQILATIIVSLCVPYFCMFAHNYSNYCRKIEYVITNPDGIRGKLVVSTSDHELSTIKYLGTTREDKISFETRNQFELVVNGKVNENTRVKILVDGKEVHNSIALIGQNVTVNYNQKVLAVDKNYWVDSVNTVSVSEFAKAMLETIDEFNRIRSNEDKLKP